MSCAAHQMISRSVCARMPRRVQTVRASTRAPLLCLSATTRRGVNRACLKCHHAWHTRFTISGKLTRLLLSAVDAVQRSGVAHSEPKKLWGGRFTGSTDPLMEKFNESLPFDKRLWKEDIKVFPGMLQLVHDAYKRWHGQTMATARTKTSNISDVSCIVPGKVFASCAFRVHKPMQKLWTKLAS